MRQNRLLRAAFRVLAGQQAGRDSNPGDVRYAIERELRKRAAPTPKVRARANTTG